MCLITKAWWSESSFIDSRWNFMEAESWNYFLSHRAMCTPQPISQIWNVSVKNYGVCLFLYFCILGTKKDRFNIPKESVWVRVTRSAKFSSYPFFLDRTQDTIHLIFISHMCICWLLISINLEDLHWRMNRIRGYAGTVAVLDGSVLPFHKIMIRL
jgi:hypothetical protein